VVLAPPVTAPPPRPLPVTATVRLGAPAEPQLPGQTPLRAGGSGLWAVVRGALVHIDPRRARVLARIPLGGAGEDQYASLLAVTAASAWVATGAGVLRVDAAANRAAATAPNGLLSPLASGAGSLWSVSCGDPVGPCFLLRLHPRTLQVQVSARLPGPGRASVGPAVDGGSAWLLDQSVEWLWRVDLASGRVATVRLPVAHFDGEGRGQVAVGAGAVWVLADIEVPTTLGARVDAGVLRVDPHGNRVTVTDLPSLGSNPDSMQLAVGAGGVWVEGQQQPGDGRAGMTIVRLDPASGRLRRATPSGDPGPEALVATSDALWLLQPAGGLLRLDPGRL
jgi:hypothetical protein